MIQKNDEIDNFFLLFNIAQQSSINCICNPILHLLPTFSLIENKIYVQKVSTWCLSQCESKHVLTRRNACLAASPDRV